MFRNYFYLNRAVTELNGILPGSIIDEIYTQEKNRLYLSISSNDLPDRHLIISTDQNIPYFQIKEEHFKAKKNSVNFFENFLPDKIEKIEIAEDDRIIKITLSASSLYFTLRGKDTNVIVVKNSKEFEAFKKISVNEEIIVNDLIEASYTSNSVIPDFSDFTFDEIEYGKIKRIFSRMPKDLFNEAKVRFAGEAIEEFKNIVSVLILEIFSKNISVFYDLAENKSYFLPSSFHKAIENNAEDFGSYLTAINKYLSVKYRNEYLARLKNEISKYLQKELYKLSSKLNNLKKRIDDGSKEELYKNYANLLLANIYLLKEKQEEITVKDYISNDDIKIKLNTKIQPKQNVDYYFDKSRDERINYKKSIELFEESTAKFEELTNLNSEFENASTVEELIHIKEKLNIKNEKQHGKRMEDQIKFRHYLIEGQYHVFVGRDSKSNDLLSTKFAKQNDYWFHARGLPGSHVVLRTENAKEGMPKNIIKDAASIAAFYSKAKTAGTAPVSYTFAKFVYKKKGMEPGQVIVQKEKVILVKPGIPNSCEILEE